MILKHLSCLLMQLTMKIGMQRWCQLSHPFSSKFSSYFVRTLWSTLLVFFLNFKRLFVPIFYFYWILSAKLIFFCFYWRFIWQISKFFLLSNLSSFVCFFWFVNLIFSISYARSFDMILAYISSALEADIFSYGLLANKKSILLFILFSTLAFNPLKSV